MVRLRKVVNNVARALLYAACVMTPWPVRRRVLTIVFGYKVHPTARIGISWIMPKRLVMGPSALILDFTVCRCIDLLQMDDSAIIGRGNWISGHPSDDGTHFSDERDRTPALILGAQSSITNRHIVDCTSTITIGKFTTVAGYQSQLLTHSIDLVGAVQTSKPITIGDYCFIGTNCVVLGGSSLPSYSVLGAKALLNKAYTTPHRLYAGVPAVPVKELRAESKYFSREAGFVD
jgi:acetyltransferase-like isoleucine patch superfamily enzyme